jgi:hypothetical protein
MGSVGDCFDNALCESFHASLKKELIHRRPWPTRAEAPPAIFRYIEGWFNPATAALTLGYLSPADYEQAHQEMIAATATTPAELTTEHAERQAVQRGVTSRTAASGGSSSRLMSQPGFGLIGRTAWRLLV